ncbi:MAG: hypothetical protein ACK55I_07750, partial [bacterium]
LRRIAAAAAAERGASRGVGLRRPAGREAVVDAGGEGGVLARGAAAELRREVLAVLLGGRLDLDVLDDVEVVEGTRRRQQLLRTHVHVHQAREVGLRASAARLGALLEAAERLGGLAKRGPHRAVEGGQDLAHLRHRLAEPVADEHARHRFGADLQVIPELDDEPSVPGGLARGLVHRQLDELRRHLRERGACGEAR